jgi:ATP/ADP translocase
LKALVNDNNHSRTSVIYVQFPLKYKPLGTIDFTFHGIFDNESNPSNYIDSKMTVKSIQTSFSIVKAIFDISRGGGAAVLSPTLGSSVSSEEVIAHNNVTLFAGLAPKPLAVLCMAIAMSLHYLGYSFARPSTIALFTSSKSGYQSPAAFPLAMAFVSPLSLILLMIYTKLLDQVGPQGALTATTLGSASILFIAAVAIRLLQDSNLLLFSVPIVKYISGPLFVFRESYVQLITSQYWSFMSSILTPEQSARWFAPISGLTSITSALAGLNVSLLVTKLGLTGAIFGTGCMMVLSVIFTSRAYSIAERHGFNPSDEHKTHKKSQMVKSEHGLIKKASSLFHRVPTLWALFIEVLCSQGLATLLNVCFVIKLTSSIPDDTERAGWMGKFFASINVITMLLQFGILPPLIQVLEPRVMWRVMPLIMVCFSGFQSTKVDPSLSIISGCLLTMKTLEYSARRMLDEMVYVPLDFESRYVGKEVVGVLAYRMGKSIMSLSLSGLTGIFGNFALQQLSLLSTGASFLWLATAWNLSNLVPTRGRQVNRTENK